MIDPKKYITYSTDDFILDEDFRKLVRNSDSNIQLNKFQESLPEKKEEIILAIQILQGLEAGKFHQPEHRKRELWHRIIRKNEKQYYLKYFKYVASILILISVGSVVLYLSTQERLSENVVSNVISSNDAVLVLSSGKTIPITSKESTVNYSANGSQVIVNDTSDFSQSNSGEGINQMIVPYGKHSFLTLSDGTKVWLNSGSKLTFPPVFKKDDRQVIVEGEAFFDVAKDPQRPFHVKTDLFKMKVYGTKFNVKAYQQDKYYNVVLVEGKVSLSSNKSTRSDEVFLNPNQKASIMKGQEEIEVTHVENTDVYTAWIDGYLVFTNEEVSDVLKQVARYYDVNIEVIIPRNTETIYGKLDLKDDLERVLDGIALISKTKYMKQDNKYVFSID
uniref:FecR family protein n=1 Tax=uncultured Draconibacterium sp. TaxID=1573823 RepID=UPI003216DDAB